MSAYSGPEIVEDGLVLCLDAANPKSYPGTGTTWFDLSGSGNNGTLVNGPVYSSANGGVIEFDGADDYVSLPNSLGYTTSVSAFAWIKTDGSPSGGFHIVFGGQQLEISIPTSGELRTGVTTNARYVNNLGSGLVDGNWHQIGFTFSGTTKTAYIDSVSVGTQTTAGTLTSSFSSRTMGRFGSSTAYEMNGFISDAKIYNRALTANEIQQNFNATKPRYGV
jgi:hypothetical protein